ncbi:replication initiator [Nonomuraea sp. NPDC050153]|uniref:replication initiator n=1 Tax=Nonomuraea sp. NPDC050153 TaxID=3364359 RepID=UPI00378B8033
MISARRGEDARDSLRRSTMAAHVALRDHARRLIITCMQLGTEPDLAELRLADWAHMLGFRSHFSTRSRHYSTTLGDIRADREHHARLNDITTGCLPLFDEDTVLVISEWEYAGKGHSLGDQLLAAAITGTQLGGIHDL